MGCARVGFKSGRCESGMQVWGESVRCLSGVQEQVCERGEKMRCKSGVRE